jgi:RNA polymerase primary sigma factor
MDAIIRANVRLLLTHAQKFRETGRRKGIFMEDLFSIACCGLRKAVLKFDFSMDCRLTTYGSWWMRQELSRNIIDLGSTIRVPLKVVEQAKKLKRIIARHQTEFGHDPDYDTLSRLSGLTFAQVCYVMAIPAEPTSLDKPMTGHDGNGDLSMIDLVLDVDHEEKTPEADMQRARVTRRLNEAMDNVLRKMERDVLDCRFVRGLTLVETAVALAKPDRNPLTRERIRQIETVALKKLRATLR